MSTESSIDGGTLTVQRRYQHGKADVFDAWIQTSKTTHWWGCKDTVKVASEIEAKVGGQYCHTMTITHAGDHTIHGRIIEFDPPNLLAYEMPGMGPGEMMSVRVEFLDTAGGTEVTLTQSVIPEPFTEIVRAGWTAAFARLAEFFEGGRRAA